MIVMEKAQEKADGEAFAHKGKPIRRFSACRATRSWNDPARFVLYDDDEPRVHQSLKAKTRLGDDSVHGDPVIPR